MRGKVLFATLIALAVSTGGDARTATTRVAKVAIIPLVIKSAHGMNRFKVEVAHTSEEQERGLMFRPHIAPDGGMIFPMNPARMASFWMKNTVSSLDIVFIRPDRTIARIAANAVPYSLEPIDSGEPVSAVLEIAGGRAAELGISANDKVSWAH
ncbi:DUF192 domain-containing protein [Sphingomonas paeninsulae]|uniref:DUF192 domain-containing protein n=1 Tax=Sphingomonas paeninsulae TaxID=2319844 RepID=A0A494TJV5_SPHPE|nr:DUF192 domain-containing protein [Sphingomonas paeninsulae]AYJ87313.1 DUF192 domain-containing protein [Sphingomonas paeninsulae]